MAPPVNLGEKPGQNQRQPRPHPETRPATKCHHGQHRHRDTNGAAPSGGKHEEERESGTTRTATVRVVRDPPTSNYAAANNGDPGIGLASAVRVSATGIAAPTRS